MIDMNDNEDNMKNWCFFCFKRGKYAVGGDKILIKRGENWWHKQTI